MKAGTPHDEIIELSLFTLKSLPNVAEATAKLKAFLNHPNLKPLARTMMMRIVLAFIMHRGRISCSATAGAIASEPIHRGELTRFLARLRWQKHDFNEPLMRMLLAKEKKRGKFMFLIDATLVSQSGKKTQNTFSTGNRTRRKIKKGSRYNKKKVVRKNVHSFTFGLLITPSGIRIPMQIPHRTKEYYAEHGIVHMTTAEAAAEMIRTLPLDDDADVVVLGDTAYDAAVLLFADTTPQTVTIRAVDDAAREGVHTSTLSHAITSTADPTNYPTGMQIDIVWGKWGHRRDASSQRREAAA